MSERYTTLWSQPDSIHTEGVPVEIAAGALLKDTADGSLYALLKFRNHSDKEISALTALIVPKGSLGEPIGTGISFQYTDLNAQKDDFFGQKTPVMLPDASAYSFSAAVTEVVFSDGGIWKNEKAAGLDNLNHASAMSERFHSETDASEGVQRESVASEGIHQKAAATEKTIKEKLSALKSDKKRMLQVGGVIAAAAVIALCMLSYKSPFEKAQNEAVDIMGHGTSGDGYFTIDTNEMDIPPDKDTSDYTRTELVWRMVNPDEQEKALEAIRKTNETLGFNGSLYSQMTQTSALMGRQSAETKRYRVSWSYHPNRGLEVTYEKK